MSGKRQSKDSNIEMTEVLELSDKKDINCSLMSNYKYTKANFKKRKLHQRNRSYEKKLNGNLRTEKQYNQNRKLDEWVQQQNGGDRKESVNLKIEQ